MKKRLLGKSMLAAVLVVSQAVTAFAAGSSTTDVTTSGESAQWYDIAGTSRENFAYLEEAEGGSEVLELIMDVNEGGKKTGRPCRSGSCNCGRTGRKDSGYKIL